MDLHLSLDRHDRLVCRLSDEGVETEATSADGDGAGAALAAAFEEARESGYGECFWPEAEGQYWWMLRHADGALDVVVMWSRGGATGWQHAFRASEDVDRFARRLGEELDRLRQA